jgi:hypothetical protein
VKCITLLLISVNISYFSHGYCVIYVSMKTKLLTRKLRTRWIPQYLIVLFHVLIFTVSMRKVRYVYRYQQECNTFHITKEVWALQLSLGNILGILPHICIHENKIIDQEAQDSLDTPISNCIISCTNFKPFVMKSYSKRCQDSWDQQTHGKLHECCI